MGLRIRKSKNFGPVRVNLSKSGIGWSIGTKGVRYTKRADGKSQTSYSIPGTGISYVDVHDTGTENGNSNSTGNQNLKEDKKKTKKPFYKKGWFIWIMLLLCLVGGCNSITSKSAVNSKSGTVKTSSTTASSNELKKDTSSINDKKEETKLTGWQKYGDKYYFYDNNGVKKTGWIQDNGHYYYLSTTGEMQTGWVKDNNKYYYLNSNGTMQTGWLQENGKWYYLNSDGTMAAGIKKDGYSIDSNGVATKIAVQSSQSNAVSSNNGGGSYGTSYGSSGNSQVSSGTVYVSTKGIYHKSSTAHGMKSSTAMSADEARSRGYRACESRSCS